MLNLNQDLQNEIRERSLTWVEVKVLKGQPKHRSKPLLSISKWFYQREKSKFDGINGFVPSDWIF